MIRPLTRRLACGGIGKRSFSARPELEKTDPPAAGDVLYRNPEAIINRLELFHHLRLQTQVDIDRLNIRHMCREMTLNTPQPTPPTGECMRITTVLKNGFPGIERQFDPSEAAIVVKLPIKSLNFNDKQQKILKRYLKVSEVGELKGETISIKINDFPFRSQNRERALVILKNLVHHAVTESVNDFELAEQEEGEAPSPTKIRTKRKPSLGFPKSWIDIATKCKEEQKERLLKYEQEKVQNTAQQHEHWLEQEQQ